MYLLTHFMCTYIHVSELDVVFGRRFVPWSCFTVACCEFLRRMNVGKRSFALKKPLSAVSKLRPYNQIDTVVRDLHGGTIYSMKIFVQLLCIHSPDEFYLETILLHLLNLTFFPSFNSMTRVNSDEQ